MSEIIDTYWDLRLKKVQKNLQQNNFDAHIAGNARQAGQILLESIVPPLSGGIAAWGGSLTLADCKVKKWFHESPDWKVCSSDDPNLGKEEKIQIRRDALLSDLYLLGTNAVSENGVLVNLDMIGNRVAALTFGPKKVVVFAGRNKITSDMESAMARTQNFAAPTNTIRLNMKTPCVSTAKCRDCSSPDRICNYWTITEKSFPPNRISVILINDDLGL